MVREKGMTNQIRNSVFATHDVGMISLIELAMFSTCSWIPCNLTANACRARLHFFNVFFVTSTTNITNPVTEFGMGFMGNNHICVTQIRLVIPTQCLHLACPQGLELYKKTYFHPTAIRKFFISFREQPMMFHNRIEPGHQNYTTLMN